MKKRIRQFGFVFLVMVIPFACYIPYQPPGIDNKVSYLVVDAFVNSTDGSATATLSYTAPLTSSDTINPINDATVKLQDESNATYELNSQGNGIYLTGGLPVQSDKKYKLVIIVSGKTYESDLVTIQPTPSIDTITWSIDRDVLDINVSTHDVTGSSKYYRWKFIETWEYRSPYQSAFIVKNDSIFPRQREESFNYCWKSSPNQKIIIYSSDYLANDVVSNFIVQSISSNSIKLSNKYSILVKQQTLTKHAYMYWLNIKKTTESLGGLFDPLPGAVVGNIQCLTNPGERVIGFFSAGEVSEKRIFITFADIISFVTYRYPYCEVDTLSDQQAKEIANNFQILTALDGTPLRWAVTSTVCSDCKVFGGGDNIKPPFWED